LAIVLDTRTDRIGAHTPLAAGEPMRHPSSGPASIVVGVSGARRNPSAAIAVDGNLAAFCEQERFTRIRGAGLRPGELPREAVNAVLGLANSAPDRVSSYAWGEEGIVLPSGLPRVRLDHHYCHAATAFLTSPFSASSILVCDQSSSPEVSVWVGNGGEIVNRQWSWRGPAFASIFTRCAEIFGFGPGQEHRLEALARVDPGDDRRSLAHLWHYADRTLHIAPEWETAIADSLAAHGASWSLEHGARVAAAIQRALAEALVALVGEIRASLGLSHLCLGGGLFYNTFFNTAIARSGIFDEVFVAPNPGNAGIAAGAALAVSAGNGAPLRHACSPFLGPGYSSEAIKATLDNCKLSYECLSDGQIVESVVDALRAGRLVGWFQGRMEWAHRALGHRSILANPASPYVLENLNGFLKQREQYRAYSLSVCEEDAPAYFAGPPRSSWMEYDYDVTDTARLKHVLPKHASTVRVHTVDATNPLRPLLKAFAAATGTGVVVNTSFNGFSEPIVCSPRDAIRVFYGTGLDVLVLGRFMLRK
jgi:carbamoyltransferase